jgi:predicted nucleic acid-binding protein
MRRAFDFYVDLNMQFGDAYHAALTERLQLTQVLSFDRDFDRVAGLERIEP